MCTDINHQKWGYFISFKITLNWLYLTNTCMKTSLQMKSFCGMNDRHYFKIPIYNFHISGSTSVECFLSQYRICFLLMWHTSKNKWQSQWDEKVWFYSSAYVTLPLHMHFAHSTIIFNNFAITHNDFTLHSKYFYY